MNLYDLSIGEDKMNQFLSIALKTHFESLKVGGKGENYWQCYQAFLKYCDIYGDCDLKDLFNNKLLRQDIVCACASYYNSSAKPHRKEAVNRFLSAIDLFYKNYIKKMGGMTNMNKADYNQKHSILPLSTKMDMLQVRMDIYSLINSTRAVLKVSG